jgi:hypothetical protein
MQRLIEQPVAEGRVFESTISMHYGSEFSPQP